MNLPLDSNLILSIFALANLIYESNFLV